LAVVLMEMAFAGNCSISVVVPETYSGAGDINTLFNEEAGIVLEVASRDAKSVMDSFAAKGVPCIDIGIASAGGDSIQIALGASPPCIDEKMTVLRDLWEATSFHLEKRQRSPDCVEQEEAGLKLRKAPQWKLTYTPESTEESIMNSASKHKVAIIRQEGSNGDREMLSAFAAAGFESWDVTVSDLVNGRLTLDEFRGIVFVGGFSYADVLDSGKGWAGVIKFNDNVFQQFEAFRNRKNTFSLGVCNGCQLMALLGWIPNSEGLPEERQPRLLENDSGRFESRFSSVKILESPAVMFKVGFFVMLLLNSLYLL
jgi:phosphoribosylformylglycinamidine synthase